MIPPHAAPRGLWATLLLVAVVCGLGLHLELRLAPAVDRMRETVERNTAAFEKLERSVQLLRIEQSSEGQGIDALLEKLGEFTPHLQQLSGYTFEYESRMGEILDAVEALGPEAYPAILAKYRGSKEYEEDELRRWLLPALIRADQRRAEGFLVSVLRGLDPDYRSLVITARNRQNAARELVEMDETRVRAGDVLAEIFSYESARGINPVRVPPHLEDRVPENGIGDGFNTLLNWYLETDHPETEAVLMRILKGSEHLWVTKQIAIKELGEMRSRAAADTIRKVYLNDPEGRRNPVFLGHCLDALGKILGSDACEFFRQQQLEVDNELLHNKLASLLAEHCGS